MLLSGLVAAWAAPAGAQDPVKLDVVPSAQSVEVGAAVTLEVTLRAADNSVAQAPKPMDVQFDVAAPFGQSALGSVSFAPGQSTIQIPLQVTAPGVWSVRALNGELLEGGTVVLGTQSQQGALPVDPPTQTADAGGTPADGGDVVTRGIDGVLAGAGAPAADGTDVALAVQPQLSMTNARIQLATSPVRGFLANGTDAAEITAVLSEAPGGAAQDIEIWLLPTLGRVTPNPLVIRRGQFVAKATLTATEVGSVKVHVGSVRPQIEIAPASDLEFRFAPPISRMQVHASPPDSSLMDMPEIIVQLTDDQNQAVATDAPRTISLRLNEGNGEVQPVEVEIPAGKFEGRAKFMPWWTGATEVVAATPHLIEQSATLHVALPTQLITLTAVGGLIGGIIAFWTNRSRWWRVVIGLFAGFVLYWAMIFGLLQSVPRNVALNPLSAFAVALIGGYIGPQMLALMAKKFGIVVGK